MFTVLLVEDNKLFRELLKETLRARFPAIRIEEAGNETDAALIVEAVMPDLILMDIRLPGAGGLELTREIKTKDHRVSIVIVTSYDLPEYREAAREYGADHFVTKGSSCWERISAIVDEVIEQRECRKESVKTPECDM